jgi:arylsulfatase
MQVYAAMIANMDAQIGTLMETLKQTGRDKNTLLVFLTDNGANPAEGFYYESNPRSGSSSIIAMTILAAKVRSSPTARTGPTSATPPTPLPQNHQRPGRHQYRLYDCRSGIVHSGKIDASTMAVYDVAPTLYEFAGIDPRKRWRKSRCCR